MDETKMAGWLKKCAENVPAIRQPGSNWAQVTRTRVLPDSKQQKKTGQHALAKGNTVQSCLEQCRGFSPSRCGRGNFVLQWNLVPMDPTKIPRETALTLAGRP